MSGHSKWSKIKRQKELTDKEKGTAFSKLSKLITLAVVAGGGMTTPENNVRLRLAIEKAKESNMPKDSIDRAIEKASGPNREESKEVLYEAFGRGGSMFIILATTDNFKRTLSGVKNVLEKYGGKLGTQGSVSYLFKKSAVIRFSIAKNQEEAVFVFADKIKAYDVDKTTGFFQVYLSYDMQGSIKRYLQNLVIQDLRIEFKPQTPLELVDSAAKKNASALIEALKNLDDVQYVFTNIKL